MLLGSITKIAKIKVSSCPYAQIPTPMESYHPGGIYLRLTADSAGLFVSPPTESKACIRLYRSESN